MTSREPLAYAIEAHDNGSNFFANCPPGILCDVCGNCLDWSYVPDKLSIRRSSNYDVSTTYDNRVLWSERAVEILVSLHLLDDENIFKIAAPYFNRFYCLPREELPFDTLRRPVRSTPACEVCGQPRDLVGATPVFLACEGLPDRRMYRSDLAFGSGKARFPLLIIDPFSMRTLRDQRLRGLDFSECTFLKSYET